MEKLELPEFIQGIATAKKSIEQRREIVTKEYKLLLGRLMNKTGKKIIHNDFLNVDVHLIYGEGGKEATNRSVFNWQSTYALLNLERVIKKAVGIEGEPIYIPAKDSGNQKKYN